MPGHHGFGLDQYERISPTRVQPSKRRPEQSIQAIESGAGLLPFEDGELLAQSSPFPGLACDAPRRTCERTREPQGGRRPLLRYYSSNVKEANRVSKLLISNRSG